jgi:hypothetical protein
MKIVNRKVFLQEMSNKNLVVANNNENGEKIYLQDLIMSDEYGEPIKSFDKNSKVGVRFINGNSLDCRKNNLEIVKLVD